jgi:hypothetical protein
MQIDKQEVVDLLRKEGKNEHAQQALQELPDKIDQEQNAQMRCRIRKTLRQRCEARKRGCRPSKTPVTVSDD